MSVTVHTRSVEIDAPVEIVSAYVGNAGNLPLWTKFFLEVGDLRQGRHAVDTVLGPAQTWIESRVEPGRSLCAICSIINGSLEKAEVTLVPGETTTHLDFTIRLPDPLPREHVENRLRILQEELSDLKVLLERAYA